MDDDRTSEGAAAGPGAVFRAGFVGLFGRPNVGKSTLLNALVGQEIALATRFPQTTRERMLGVWTTDRFQAVLVDTPGIHRAKSALNRFMVGEAIRTAADVDVLLMLAEAPRLPDLAAAEAWKPGEGAVAALGALTGMGRPLVLVLTKCDRLPSSDQLLPIIARWGEHHAFDAVLPTSALKRGGLDALRLEVERHLPQGPAYYDPDQLSDRTLRWHAAEIIRGALFAELADELPYSCAVTIDRFDERADDCLITATVHVERASQKGIVIGAKAHKIRSISMAARRSITELVGKPCTLVLEVRVTENWTRDAGKLKALGYTAPTGGGKDRGG